MPELPEVETIARWLRRYVQGRRVEDASLLHPDFADDPWGLRRALSAWRGRAVGAVERRGKMLRLRLGEGWLYLHLGMTGRLYLVAANAPLAPHTHFRMRLAGGEELRCVDPRRFGGVGWAQGRESPLARRWARLGPDALAIGGREWTALFGRRRPVKALLLDQSLIAGVGNIYADEALFRARVHPALPAHRLAPEGVRRLCRALRCVLREAIEAGGSTLRDYRLPDGSPGRFQMRHRVYGRTGEPCLRCGTPIRRIRLAGRSAHFCPRCQPGPPEEGPPAP
jgi:formamidopyrimidine-DNA glycosylase